MKVTCDGCHTIYNIPESKEGILGCPYCEHVNVPKQPIAAPENRSLPNEEAFDHSQTMLGPLEGLMADETSSVHKALAGRTIGLSSGHEAALIIIDGDGKGKRIPLSKSKLVIGRKQADIALSDPEASRRHCALILYGDLAFVKDLNSANGTMINQKIVKEGLLRPGDRLQIGTTVFEFTVTPLG